MVGFKVSTLFILLLGLVAVNSKTFVEDLTITDKEKQILDKFRDRMISRLPHDYMKTELYLVRWLRIANFDIPKAEKMLVQNLKWREENDMDNILHESFPEMEKRFRYSLKSRDKDGRPVLYGELGDWDTRATVLSGKRDQLFRYLDQMGEKGATLIREVGEKYQNVSQGMILINVKGFNVIQHACLQCIPVLLRVIDVIQSHYPGMVDKYTVVNVPEAAMPLIRIIQSTAPEYITKDFSVYGRNRGVWLPSLLKDISLEQLPRSLGGSLDAFDEDKDDGGFDYDDYVLKTKRKA